MKRWLLVLLGVLGVVLVVGGLGFVIWGLNPLEATPVALESLQSNDLVNVAETDLGWEFTPVTPKGKQGLIFYPGGHVDARAYAPLARSIAATGRFVIITPMPLSLAVLDPNAADAVIDEHTEIKEWVIGGHSLGGAMAAQYAADHPGYCDGILLLAAYATESADLSGEDMSASDVYGTEDAVLDAENHQAGKAFLPKDTAEVVIQGGNHAQFGNYGDQPGDGEAKISTEAQQAATVSAANDLFARVAAP